MIANNGLDVYLGTNIKIISEEKAIKCLFCNFNLFFVCRMAQKTKSPSSSYTNLIIKSH